MAGMALRVRSRGAAGAGTFARIVASAVSYFAGVLRRAARAVELGFVEAVLARRGDAAVFFLGEDLIGFIAHVSS